MKKLILGLILICCLAFGQAPNISNFNWVNQSSATGANFVPGPLVMHSPPSGSANQNLLVQPIGTNTTVEAELTCNLVAGGTNANCLVGFYDSVTGRVLAFYISANTTDSTSGLFIFRWNSVTSFNSEVGPVGSGFTIIHPITVKLKDDGVTLTISYIFNVDFAGGNEFPIVYSEPVGSFLTPDNWGFGVDAEGSTQDVYAVISNWVTN